MSLSKKTKQAIWGNLIFFLVMPPLIWLLVTHLSQKGERPFSEIITDNSWYAVYVEKTEALTTLCRNTVPNVKPIAPRYLDGQLKSAWRGPSVRFFQYCEQ